MPGRARGKQVAGDIRGGWIRACKQLEEEGTPISLLIKEAIQKDVLAAISAISKFVPKEMMLQGDPDNPMEGNLSITVNYRKPEESKSQ